MQCKGWSDGDTIGGCLAWETLPDCRSTSMPCSRRVEPHVTAVPAHGVPYWKSGDWAVAAQSRGGCEGAV